MTEAPSFGFLKRRLKRKPPSEGARELPATPWSSGSPRPVEIVAPDHFSSTLLVEYAGPLFPAEIVAGSKWTVRLQPPAAGGGWVLDLLALVQRWLESARLPSANVLYGDRSYLIRASSEAPQLLAAMDTPSASAPGP